MIKIYSIYKIYDVNDINQFYIGSTCLSLEHRLRCHKNESKINPERKFYKYIFENGGWENFQISEIYKFPAFDVKFVRQMEEESRLTLKPTLNSYSCCGFDRKKYDKENYQKNKDKINEKKQCECGRFVSRKHMRSHKKTKIHNKLMNK